MNNYELTTEQLVRETRTYKIPANSLKEASDLILDGDADKYEVDCDVDDYIEDLFPEQFRVLDDFGNIVDEDGNVTNKDGDIIDEDGNVIE